MYKILVIFRNVITGEEKKYQSTQKYNSPGKAAKFARRLMDDITCNGTYADDNEYTVKVVKVKHG